MQMRMHRSWRRKRTASPTGGASALAALLITLLVASFVAPGASASPLPPIVTLLPGGPFSSGQLVEVHVAHNEFLEPGVPLTIEECTAPGPRDSTDRSGLPWVDDQRVHCDSRTRQHGRLVAGKDGSLDFLGYPVYSLPDALTLHESVRHQPLCDLTHACVLVISGGQGEGDGDHDSDDAGRSVWSLPFLVGPAVDPPPSTPEVPYTLALPVLAGGIIGGSVLFRRRRSSPS